MKKIEVKKVSSLIATIEYLQRSGADGFTRVFTVTPEDAMYILDKYDWKNRDISQLRVIQLATLMRRGEYEVDCETLKVGRIKEEKNRPIRMDGSHRLWAVIEADVSVEMEFKFYDPYSEEKNTRIMASLDRPRVRNTVDTLRLLGIPDATLTLSIIRHLLRHYELKDPFIGYNLTRTTQFMTDTMCVAFYHKHLEEITRVVAMTKKLKSAKFSKPSLIGALYYHYRYQLKNSKMDQFIDDICSGANLKSNSVELALSKFLRLFSGVSSYRTSKVSEAERNIACNMAFEHFHNRPGYFFKGFSYSRMCKWLENLGVPSIKLLGHST